MRKEADQDKTKIGVDTSVTVKFRDIDEKIREGKIISMRKGMFGLYYLTYIASVLFLSHFWLLIPVLSMLYRW